MSKNDNQKNSRFDGHEFKKSLGQNFISDINLLSAIGEDSGVTENDFVVEVGAGAGTLTSIISDRCKKMISFEVDQSLEERLRIVEGSHSNLTVYFKDIMEVDLNDLSKYFNESDEGFSYKVVANLPYYITTPIIFKFLEDAKRLKSLTIMVQKEVGERIIAKPNSSEYGALSAMVNFYGNAKITRIVKRQNFYPMPKVDSCIVRIDIDNTKFNGVSSQAYKKIVRVAFNNRRKTLSHNLVHDLGLQKEKVSLAFQKLGLDEKIRGEALTSGQFLALINELNIQ